MTHDGKHRALTHIRECGIVTAIRVETGELALAALQSLLAGGIGLAEIAMSMACGIRTLELAARQLGSSMLLGAGTILDPATAVRCIHAGAGFLVSPSLNVSVIEVGRRYGVPVICGALSPSEVFQAWSEGADCVKIFPAAMLGGPSYIRSLKVAMPLVKLMPMGGVSLASAGAYLAAGSFALGVGSDLVSPTLNGNTVEQRARAFRAAIQIASRDVPAKGDA